MIRTKMTMLALGVLALSGVSAMAATTKTSHHQVKAAVSAPAEGGTPAAGDAAKPAEEPKKAKKSKGGHKMKDKAAGGETAPAPTPEAK
jgi:hypothetical protein